MDVLERFLNYVKIHTSSDEASGTHPSFVGEFELADFLKRELEELGLKAVKRDPHCYVYAKLPASPGYEHAEKIGFIAHMDTSPDASGKNVDPQLHKNYDGKALVLAESGAGAGMLLEPSAFPFLKSMIGETIVTSDGTTLLGADDKAGIAEIMTAMEEMIHSDRPHGPICIAFTPDEEIGEGTAFFDLAEFDADVAYTVDGGDVDCIEYENFNAASAVIRFKGQSVHPGDGKMGMKNAAKIAMQFQNMLPKEECPECTEGYEGFFHLTDMSGNVSEAELHYLVRDHDRQHFEQRKALLESCAKKINAEYGEGTARAEIKDSYYNMEEKIRPHMYLVDTALEAVRRAGFVPKTVPIRGGTDGARLSFMGLPCPNLGTGGFNFHGEYELITKERMEAAVQIIRNIAEMLAEK